MRTIDTALGITISLGALLGLGACSPGSATRVPGLPTATIITRVTVLPTVPLPVTEPSAIVSETPLRPEVGPATGIGIEPGSGRRLILGRDGAVSDLETGEVVWRSTRGGAEPFGFTDFVVLSEAQLAITSVSNGFLVDLPTSSMLPHFCYEPEGWEEVPNEPVQITSALAFDRVRARFYAQPRTIEAGGYGATAGSFIAAYDAGGGADVAWWALPDASFVASGMIVVDRGAEPQLLLASGTNLLSFDVAAAELTPAADLAALGVHSIAGLALDARADTLLVLDDSTSSVIEIRMSALGLD